MAVAKFMGKGRKPHSFCCRAGVYWDGDSRGFPTTARLTLLGELAEHLHCSGLLIPLVDSNCQRKEDDGRSAAHVLIPVDSGHCPLSCNPS